jgi:hypothetical protein
MGRLSGALALVLLGSTPNPPSGWGCTADTLASGERCIFEGTAPEGARADPQENVKAMSALADAVCALHLKPSERSAASDAVRDRCKAEVQSAAREACAVPSALRDDDGRFVPAAKGCYRALTEVRQHAEWQAATLAPCCACLAEQHCVAGPAQCVQSAQAHASVEAVNDRCALASCEAACAGLLPGEAEASPAPARPRAAHR